MEDLFERPRKCPPKAHLQGTARHNSPASYDGPSSAQSLRNTYLQDFDPEGKSPEASRFLEEVRVRLFASMPSAEKRGDLSPMRTAVTVTSQAPYVSPSMGASKRPASRDGSSQRVSALETERASSERQGIPSAGAASENHSRGLRASASRTSPLGPSRAKDKENVPGRQANVPAAPRPSLGSRKLDFTARETPEAPSASAQPTSACEASPLFSPMQIDEATATAAPSAEVPPVPGFLKRHVSASSGTATEAQPGSSASNDAKGPVSSSRVPSSRVSGLQRLASIAAQEAAALMGADEELADQVRDMLRASVGSAARAAGRLPSGALPQGSSLLWSVLEQCLRQQAEVLFEQHSYKAAARDAMAQASRNQKEGEELIRKAQRYMRDTKAHARKSAAAAEEAAQQLAAAQEALRQRDEELEATSAWAERAEEKARAAQLEATQAQAALNEVLAARRGGREALSEMAAQNARLVVGYCAKKAELRRLQEALASERARWEARLQRLESGQYTGAPRSRSARKTCPLVDDTMEPSGCAASGAASRMKSAADQEGKSWEAERERLTREKATLQRECRTLLERLQDLQAPDAAAASVDSPQIQLASGLTREASGASSDLGSTADAEAEIRRLTQENTQLRRQTEAAQERSTAAERRQQAEVHKQAGNIHFQRGQHSAAAEEYTAGLAAAQPDQSQLKAVLHCNRAAAMAALGQHTEAVSDCCAAITLDPAYLKAFQRRAEAAAALGDVSSAVQDWSLLVSKGVTGAHTKLLAAQRAARTETLPNYYAVLGLNKAAPTASIRTAFRQLALRFHPDKASGPGQKEAAEKLFRLISDAHSTLSDPEQRRMYDLDIMRKDIQARARSPRFR